MAKRKGKQAILRQQLWDQFLLSPRTSEALRSVSNVDFRTPLFLDLLEEASDVFGEDIETPAELLDAIRRSKAYWGGRQDPQTEAFHAISHFEESWKDFLGRNPTHWEKRWHVHELGLNVSQYSALSIIENKVPRDRRPFKMKFIERRRKDGIKRYHDLYDTPTTAAKSYAVDISHGYYTVPPDESVVFYSRGENGQINLELVVIRDVTKKTSFADALYLWLESVVDSACSERRDVRPNHPGCMTQIGLNLGPRHARILGWAKSFVRKLTRTARIDRDTDAVGAVSIIWSIIQSVMPQEILTEVDDALEADDMPRLATRDVGNGHGFHIKAKGTTYLFPTAERAPPEAYFSVGYQSWTHVDPAYCNWAFASCVARRDTSPKKSNCGTKCKAGSSSMPGAGANFVDASLRVVVQQAARTIIAFRPDYLHGTTRSQGAENAVISISFSQRVSTAWAAASALEKAAVVAGAGAGIDSRSDST